VVYCIVLYCIVLYCIELYCIVLYSVVLWCIVLYCFVLCCIVLYCIVLYCIVLYFYARSVQLNLIPPKLVTEVRQAGWANACLIFGLLNQSSWCWFDYYCIMSDSLLFCSWGFLLLNSCIAFCFELPYHTLYSNTLFQPHNTNTIQFNKCNDWSTSSWVLACWSFKSIKLILIWLFLYLCLTLCCFVSL